ncbi:MAG: CRISPR system precrRNA processing endoribonuclease RAMP protein Cas6 [Clostridium sp.]|nr:CRISPR system precrRNA processing endoribonuclease RAMP protein Cas6 [Clostridium sp.]MDY4079940.1 CRISPR system precrRNA processing endoribonuclease RAMP protein Cas6 [Clostridium sp.]
MYNIRYIKLNFTIKIKENGHLPEFKNSTFRGGMGRMLMEFFCLNDGECSECNTVENCMVKKVMYSKLKKKPNFIANDNSVGYIIECFDKRTEYKKNDIFKFNLILFGDTINYISHFIYAFDVLGLNGIGKYYIHYEILNVCDDEGNLIFADGNINKKNIKVKYVREYIENRKKSLINRPQIFLNFISPFRYKFQGHLKADINIQDLILALNRRINILYAYEGIDLESNVQSLNIEMLGKNLYWKENARYSEHQNQKMKLGGVEGTINLNVEDEEFINLLLAGELLHIGKNTSFGLGKYLIN